MFPVAPMTSWLVSSPSVTAGAAGALDGVACCSRGTRRTSGPVDDLVLPTLPFRPAASSSTYRAANSAGSDSSRSSIAAPDLGVLQRQRATEAPQHRVHGVGLFAGRDGLGVAGQDEQFRLRCACNEGGGKSPRRVKFSRYADSTSTGSPETGGA